MNNDREQKRRYEMTLNKLNIIGRKIDELNRDLISLEQTLKNNMRIDDKPIENESLIDTEDKIRESSRSLRNTAIPYVKRKIYEY